MRLQVCFEKCVRDRRRSTGRLFHVRGPATAKARSPMVECRVTGTRTSAVQSTTYVSLFLTAAGLTRTNTSCGAAPFIDSGALERKVYTGCVQALLDCDLLCQRFSNFFMRRTPRTWRTPKFN